MMNKIKYYILETDFSINFIILYFFYCFAFFIFWCLSLIVSIIFYTGSIPVGNYILLVSSKVYRAYLLIMNTIFLILFSLILAEPKKKKIEKRENAK